MSTDDERPDDPVASALVEGSTYDRIRVQRISTFKWPTRLKLFRLGGLSSLLAVAVLSLSILPPRVVAFLPVDPYTTLTRVVLVASIGAAVMGLSGTLLVITAIARPRLEPMDEARAEAVLAFEEMWSLIGFVIGGGTAAIAAAFVLAAHMGVDVLEAVFTLIGPMAYQVVQTPVTPSAVAVCALGVGLALLIAGAGVPAE
ncbi:hypothetical protein [Halosegnis sp.]|uniref:hypothetical protein n=1 Tax=Halosegnis sp. TaxID=2864959 RepID=UPI0035D43B5C